MKRMAQIGSMAALAAMLFVGGGQSSAQEAAAVPVGDAKKGRDLYMVDGCYQCHGRHGQGGRGPTLAANELPVEAFIAFLRAPTGNMPPYDERVLTEAAAADIHAFIRGLPGPLPDDQMPVLLKR